MNEDDTFRVLRKPPFKDMAAMVDEYPDAEWTNLSDEAIDEFFKEWGWDYAEYTREYLKYMRI